LGRVKDDLIEEDFVLLQSGKKKSLARQRYKRFVMEGLNSGHQENYYEAKDQRIPTVERLKDKLINKGKKKYFITMA